MYIPHFRGKRRRRCAYSQLDQRFPRYSLNKGASPLYIPHVRGKLVRVFSFSGLDQRFPRYLLNNCLHIVNSRPPRMFLTVNCSHWLYQMRVICLLDSEYKSGGASIEFMSLFFINTVCNTNSISRQLSDARLAILNGVH